MSRLSFLQFSVLNLIPGPVKPSKWQKWGPWSHCSTSCDKGHRVRARACSGSHASCPGEPTETKDCLLTDCPGWLFCNFPFMNFFLHMSAFFFPNVLIVSFVSPVFSISTLNYFNLCCQLVWSACQHQIAYILKFCIKQLLRGMSFLIWRFRLRDFHWYSFQLHLVNGKDGVIGPNARLRVAREPESGLELAAKMMGHVEESPPTPKIAFW